MNELDTFAHIFIEAGGFNQRFNQARVLTRGMRDISLVRSIRCKSSRGRKEIKK